MAQAPVAQAPVAQVRVVLVRAGLVLVAAKAAGLGLAQEDLAALALAEVVASAERGELRMHSQRCLVPWRRLEVAASRPTQADGCRHQQCCAVAATLPIRVNLEFRKKKFDRC